MITKPRKIFIENLKEVMSEKEKTQADISNDLKIPLSTISSWVNGQSYPRVDRMQQLADYFNISMRRLTDEWNKKDDEVINVIGRASQTMTKEEKETMLQILKAAFKDKFEE